MSNLEIPADARVEELSPSDEAEIADFVLALQLGLDDVLKATERIRDRRDRLAWLENHPIAENTDRVIQALAHIPGLYGYKSSNTLYEEAKGSRDLQVSVSQGGEALGEEGGPWGVLGVKTTEGRRIFEKRYGKTQPFGKENLNDDENPYAAWMEMHDPENLAKLETSLSILEARGYKPELIEMTTPPVVKGAAQTIANTQEGFTYCLGPYLATGLEPVVLQESIDTIHSTHEKELERLAANYDPDTIMYSVAEYVIEEEYKRALDIEGALSKLDAMIELGLQINVDDIRVEDQPVLDDANQALEEVRHVYARDRVTDDFYDDAIDGPFNVVLSGAVGAATLGMLSKIPGTPEWLLQSLAGYLDDIAMLGALVMSAGNMSKVQLLEQGAVAVGALVGFTDLARHIDSLASSGSEVKYIAAGSIFALAALGVAAAGSVVIGAQKGKELRELAKQYKLPDYMPIPESLRPQLAACTSLAEAITLIEQEKMSWGLEEAQYKNITQKLERISDDENWREHLGRLTTLPKHPKWDSFKQAMDENPLQRLLFLAQGMTAGVDIGVAPLIRHDPALLAILGSTEGAVAFALYEAHKHHLVAKARGLMVRSMVRSSHTQAA